MGKYSVLNLSIVPPFSRADTVDLERNISPYCPPSHAIIYIYIPGRCQRVHEDLCDGLVLAEALCATVVPEVICMCVCRYAEHEVVLEYAKWALEKDEEMAINIFTNREDSSLLPAAQVLDFLTNFPTATVAYLEYVIHQQGSKVTNQQGSKVTNHQGSKVTSTDPSIQTNDQSLKPKSKVHQNRRPDTRTLLQHVSNQARVTTDLFS